MGVPSVLSDPVQTPQVRRKRLRQAPGKSRGARRLEALSLACPEPGPRRVPSVSEERAVLKTDRWCAASSAPVYLEFLGP